MIGLEDREEIARDIEAACDAGARLKPACELMGISARTLQRWKAGQGLESGDGRPQAVRPADESLAQHAELLEALRDHDGDRASQLTSEHIMGALTYLDARDRSPKRSLRIG